MRKQTHSQFLLKISRVLSLAGSLALAGYLGAFIATEHAAWAKSGGGGGGNGNGTGNGGSGSGSGVGVGAGVGVGIGGTGAGVGVGVGIGGTGSGTGAASSSGGTGVAAGGSQSGSTGSISGAQDSNPGGTTPGNVGVGRETATREQEGFFTRLMRTIGLASPEPVVAPAMVTAPPSLGGVPRNTPPSAQQPVAASTPKLPEQTQAFRFEVGTAVFPTTGGVFTTEGVDGVDVVTVDARHHRVIHPAAFFEPHEGAKYDRRAVESFWPIEVGKRVRFVESLGTARWEHVMSAIGVETVSVPAGVFRAFVVEHTVQPLGQGPQPVATHTYWYAPGAGAIVKSQFQPGDGKPPVTDEADVLGYPLTLPITASTGLLE